jgi:hypothetical protein
MAARTPLTVYEVLVASRTFVVEFLAKLEHFPRFPTNLTKYIHLSLL